MYKADDIQTDPIENRKFALHAIRWSLLTATILIILKTIAYAMSSSTSMLASLTDTLGDLVISLLTYFSVKISIMPADEEHRYGHGKVEGFSALLQGSFLAGSAVFLILETIIRLSDPTPIINHGIGIGVSVISILLTIILVTAQNYALKKAPSLAVEADQKHYTGDIYLNLAVIISFVAHLYTHSTIIDALIALSAALYIGYSGFCVGKKAVDMLMDREIGEKERKEIIDTVDAHKDVLGMHDLRTRRSGMNIYISFDIELDPQLSLEKAHDITRDLEHALVAKFPHAEIIIHMDPKGDTFDIRHKVEGVHH